MYRLTRAAIATATLAAVILAPMAQSFSGDRDHDRRGYHGYKYGRHFVPNRSNRPVIVYRDHSGDALAAGVIGLALGAIIAGAVTAPEPDPYPPFAGYDPDYYPAPPANFQDQASYGASEPWSDAWYEYCTRRFRSFDTQSGTYLGYDGKRHFCVAR